MISTICLSNIVTKHMLWMTSAEAWWEELFLDLTSREKGVKRENDKKGQNTRFEVRK